MKKLVFVGIITIIILVSLATGCTEEDEKDEEEEEEEELPDLGSAPGFTLTSIDKVEFSLSDFEGKVVILDFMATWCGPCKSEMIHLKDVYYNYSESEVQIISIDTDESESDMTLYNFSIDWGEDWIYAIDRTGDVEQDYSISNIPKLVLIDKQGNIRYEKVGITTYEDLSSMIDQLL
ncbi:MAG: TlpA family protein disulfide reductase [Thermoplasmata archaeon]|nr:MAG: TlpA family protein disulfide reductase [Thermoplasmata archaeon]